MEKLQRSERIAVLMKLLSDTPGKVFTLGAFAEMFGSAKSTISEDIDVVQELLEKYGLGTIESIAGASGGVKYVPKLSEQQIFELLNETAGELTRKERILPGGYLYMLDIIYDPQKISAMGRIFATRFSSKNIDYVLTMETKGIPLAFATARYLNVPLIIVRHNNEATDGASVNINYVSGSSSKIQTMVLPMKALKRNSRLLFIDDFMKGGGTAKGIVELARQFECEVAGIGVLVETSEPVKKLVDDYYSLLTLNFVNQEEGIIDLKPSKKR
ncbi:MAG: pur operon repressor [Bacillota bacterium]|nr:pur operon repressor [Bacillota bacterium]